MKTLLPIALLLTACRTSTVGDLGVPTTVMETQCKEIQATVAVHVGDQILSYAIARDGSHIPVTPEQFFAKPSSICSDQWRKDPK